MRNGLFRDQFVTSTPPPSPPSRSELSAPPPSQPPDHPHTQPPPAPRVHPLQLPQPHLLPLQVVLQGLLVPLHPLHPLGRSLVCVEQVGATFPSSILLQTFLREESSIERFVFHP